MVYSKLRVDDDKDDIELLPCSPEINGLFLCPQNVVTSLSLI